MKKLVLGLIVAVAALALHAAVHEDDWLKVETPDKVVPDSGFQVKVTLKKSLGPNENVTVAMHTFKSDGGWMGTGEWRPPQAMKKGETKIFSFTAKGSGDCVHRAERQLGQGDAQDVLRKDLMGDVRRGGREAEGGG